MADGPEPDLAAHARDPGQRLERLDSMDRRIFAASGPSTRASRRRTPSVEDAEADGGERRLEVT
jgi:hypothetical protein